jgi:hypothetical protein
MEKTGDTILAIVPTNARRTTDREIFPSSASGSVDRAMSPAAARTSHLRFLHISNLMHPPDVFAAGLGLIFGALLIYKIVRFVNDRSELGRTVPMIIVGTCLWSPFSWILFEGSHWDDYQLLWLRMWPVLPGLVPGAYFFHAKDEWLEFGAMAATTLLLFFGLSWLGTRNRSGMLAATIVALAISIPTAMLALAMYRF